MTLLAAGCTDPRAGTSWQQRAPMEEARSEIPAAVIDDLVYLPGGLVSSVRGIGVTESVERYSTTADRWEPVAELLEPRHHAMAASVDGRLYVLGGFDATGFNPVDSAWVLDPAAVAWTEIADLPKPVGAGAAVAIDGLIYLAGGFPGGRSLLVYDPTVDLWEGLGPMSHPREHTAAVAFEGDLWVLGGRWDGEVRRDVEIFDPETGSWSPGPEMTEARSGFGAATIGDSIIVAGGEVFDPTLALDSAETYDGTEWKLAEPLPRALHGLSLVAVGGELFVLGGSIRAGDVANTGEVWVLQP
jgi:N-acetylneuraminic acid mutarotase